MLKWLFGTKSLGAESENQQRRRDIEHSTGASAGADQKDERRSRSLILLLNTLGFAVPQHFHSTSLGVFAVVSITNKLLEERNQDVSDLSRDERLVLGIFIFCLSNVVSQLQRVLMESVSTMAYYQLSGFNSNLPNDPVEIGTEINEVISLYNMESRRGENTSLIGNNIVRWFREPTPKNFDRLAELLDDFLKHVKLQ